MKISTGRLNSSSHNRVLVAGIMALFLTGCSGSDKTDAPTPKPKYDIVCRFTGANIGGLGSQIDTYIKPSQQPEFHVATYGVPDNGQVEYPGIGSAPDNSEFALLVSFRNVTPKGTVRPKADSKLTAEVLVNGKLKTTLVLDNTTQFGNTDYLYAISKFDIK